MRFVRNILIPGLLALAVAAVLFFLWRTALTETDEESRALWIAAAVPVTAGASTLVNTAFSSGRERARTQNAAARQDERDRQAERSRIYAMIQVSLTPYESRRTLRDQWEAAQNNPGTPTNFQTALGDMLDALDREIDLLRDQVLAAVRTARQEAVALRMPPGIQEMLARIEAAVNDDQSVPSPGWATRLVQEVRRGPPAQG